MTHTVAELQVSPLAYDEIAALLRQAGYEHVFMEGGMIDMAGIGLTRGAAKEAYSERRQAFEDEYPKVAKMEYAEWCNLWARGMAPSQVRWREANGKA